MSQTADAFMAIFGMKRVKPRKCKVCGEKFTPTRAIQPVCARRECMLSFATAAAEKAKRKRLEQHGRQQRKAIRERREALKTRSDYLKEAQAAFNAWVRWRDRDLPCICCALPLTLDAVGGGYDAGHYRSVGSAPQARFNEDNVHAQRKQCNRWGAGRAVDYRLGLIVRIGLARVEALEADQSVKKWTVPELIAIRDEYRRRLKEAKREQ